MRTFSTPEVAELAGTTCRVIDYLVRSDLLRHVGMPCRNTYETRRWTPEQAQLACVLVALRKLGAKEPVLDRVVSRLALMPWDRHVVIDAEGNVDAGEVGFHVIGRHTAAWIVDLRAYAVEPEPAVVGS